MVLSAAVSISFELPYSGLVYWLPFYLAGCWAGLHRKTFFSLQRPAMAQATLVMLWLFFFTIMIYRPNTRLILLFRLLSPWALAILYDRLHLDVVMSRRVLAPILSCSMPCTGFPSTCCRSICPIISLCPPFTT